MKKTIDGLRRDRCLIKTWINDQAVSPSVLEQRGTV